LAHNVKYMLRRFEKRPYFRGKTINTRFLHVSNGKEVITRYYKKIEALKQQTAAGLRTRAIGNMFFTAV